jgi:PAS domain S-box-containing protein
VDVSTFPGLAAAIRNRSTVFAVGASKRGSLGAEPGFYLLEAARFGRGPASRGFVVAFVPQGWFTSTQGGDPRRVAISQDGRRLEGDIAEVQAAASFDALGSTWRVDVAREPASGLQSTMPWLALAWPVAAALIAFGVGRAILLRRRAERDVERIFDLSLDMLASAGFDGYLKRLNPAVVRTLGYTRQELLSRPLTEFVHPDERDQAREMLKELRSGSEVIEFENRFLTADGSTKWLEVSCRAVPSEGIVYASARDITDRKRSDEELRHAHQMVETSRDELAASRARVVAAAAEERRRVVRDLHDGAQQSLVHTLITLKMALRDRENRDGPADPLVSEALEHAEEANAKLRALARGILPPVLAKGGLRAGIDELVSRSSVPVATDISPERLPSTIEATAYFVVSEALTNVMKHSGAQRAEVRTEVENQALRVEIRDDGVGGAGPRGASGLTGLRDRVEAVGGTIEIVSPASGGTSVVVEIPVG